MPLKAIATGHIDIVLPVAEMPERLIQLERNAHEISMPGNEATYLDHADPLAVTPEQSEQALLGVMAKLHARTGHDFSHYKRATVLRRIERRLQVNGLPNVPAYLNFLDEHPPEIKDLLKDMLISVTNFYRDRLSFEALERGVVDNIIATSSAEQPVRAWVAGCATGEEAYSLAMLFAERHELAQRDTTVQIFASDIDEPALSFARQGVYPESIVLDVPPGRLREFFVKEGASYYVKKSVRETVLFSSQNILQDPPFSRLDLITCRNLLIYLERDAQYAVFETFHFALKPGGFLFLGNSESAEAAGDLFSVIDKKNRIYRANAVSRSHRRGLSTRWNRIAALSDTPSPVRDRAERAPMSFEKAHESLVSQYAPPSILIDRDYNIVHVAPGADQYLARLSGTPSLHLLSIIRPELRQDLRTALFKAMRSGVSVDIRHRGFELGQWVVNVNITARPVAIEERPYVLIVFDAVDTSLDNAISEGNDASMIVSQLEEEIRQLKRQLQETIDDAETSTEELKTANEESQSVNEELRSATEELETSKEELQSINEELITVNSELKTKVDEAGRVNEDLQNFIAASDIATIFVDREIRIRRFAPKALSLFSLIDSDVGRSLLDINHRLRWPSLIEDLTIAIESNRASEREVQDADDRTYVARASAFTSSDGVVQGAILTFVDVTRLREAESRVRASEARLSLMAKTTKDYAIVSLDSAGNIIGWNAGAETIFGYTESEALGHSGNMLYAHDASGRRAFEEEMRTAVTTGRVADERWYTRKNGEHVFCSGIMVSLFADDGSFEGFAKIARDFTKRERLERVRARRLVREKEVRHASQQANQLKDQFLAIMSHELKHPLNLISVNAELMARLPGVQGHGMMARALSAIGKAVKSQAKIIDDLLDLSRVNTGKLSLSKASFDAIAVLESIVDSAKEVATAKHVVLRFEHRQTAVHLHADVVRFEQIAWNLISNALKFTPADGMVTVHAGIEDGFFRLDVVDTGAGMEVSEIPHVFDLFKQADNSAMLRSEGLGIGLALVKELAEAHGGRVNAVSDGVGQGMTFSVWFPAFIRDAALLNMASSSSTLGGVRILLVDDSTDVIDALAALLETDGASVTAVRSGAEAIACLAAQDYDLLISDVGMPGMSGYELVERLQAMDDESRPMALALTGYGRSADIEKALAAGFDAHMTKPVSLAALQRVVAEMLQRRKSQTGPRTAAWGDRLGPASGEASYGADADADGAPL